MRLRSSSILLFFLNFILFFRPVATNFTSVAQNSPRSCLFERIRNVAFNHTLTVFIENNVPFAFYNEQLNIYKGIEISLIEAMAKHLKLQTVYASVRNTDEEDISCMQR